MSEPLDLDGIERWLDPATPEAWSQAMRDEALVLHAREDVPALVAEVRALRAKVEAVRAIHTESEDGPWCGECGLQWPCETLRSVDTLAVAQSYVGDTVTAADIARVKEMYR